MARRIVTVLVATLLAVAGIAAPAYASTKTACDRNVCLTVALSGHRVGNATVQLQGGAFGASISYDYYSPQWSNSATQTCTGLCAYTFHVNYTYPAGQWVQAWALYGGVMEGLPRIQV
jgi:uncharacterized membrane protein